jgi:hypothetical protein
MSSDLMWKNESKIGCATSMRSMRASGSTRRICRSKFAHSPRMKSSTIRNPPLARYVLSPATSASLGIQ